MGEILPTRLLLAQSAKAAVVVSELVAYGNGFEVAISLRLRVPDHRGIPGFLHGQHEPDEPVPPDAFRFGVQFSDGRQGITSGGPLGGQFGGKTDDAPQGPIIMARIFGGGGRLAEYRFWVWPLPPAGPLMLMCEWPAQEIPLTTKEFDAALILDGSRRSESLWHDDEGRKKT